jgi:lipopolysaccharide transport system ATP-binding protein
MAKLKEIGRTQGRAVILVSHSMSAVRAMCTKALLLNSGEVKAYGEVDDIIVAYQRESERLRTASGRVDLREWSNRGGTAAGARITWAEIGPAEQSPHQGLRLGDAVRLTFACEFDTTHVGKPITLAVSLSTADGVPLAYMVDQDSHFEINEARREEIVSIVLRDIRFYPGLYYLSLFVGLRHSEALDDCRDCVTLEVEPGGLTVRTLPRHSGVLFLTPEWTRA